MRPIDLTMSISPLLPTFPGSPKPQFIQWESMNRAGYNLELIFLSTHTGTHLDAPYHFAKKGRKVHQISLNRLIQRATLMRIPKLEDQCITKDEIVSFEGQHGSITKGATIIFNTGWSKSINRPTYFKKNPGISMDAAQYIVARGANMVGIDSPSIDSGAADAFPAHNILAENDILILENLINLEKICRTRFDLVVLPLKLHGATGSPIRAIAL